MSVPSVTNLSSTTPVAETGRQLAKWQAGTPYPTTIDINGVPTLVTARDASAEFRNLGGVDARTGTSETIGMASQGKLVTLINASAIAASLDTSSADSVFMCQVEVGGAGAATLTPNSGTINGASNLVVAAGSSGWLWRVGSNWHFVGTTGGGTTAGGVNAQTGTSYTVVSGDNSKLVTIANASAIAVTLPNANTLANTFFVDLENRGAGTVTITPTTSTIDGAPSITLLPNQGIRIFGDASNYFTQRGSGLVNPMTTKGDVIVADTSGVPTRLAPGTAGTALISNGPGVAPSYQAVGTPGLPLWLQQHPDAYPTSPNADDDEFDGGSISGSWTPLNAAGSTVFSQANGRLTAVATNSGSVLRGYYKALPGAGAWEYRTKIYYNPSNITNQSFTGICLLESATGKVDVLYAGRSASGTEGMFLDHWLSSGSTSAGATAIAAISGIFNPIYLKVTFDGTTYGFSYGSDGVAYFFVAGRTATTDFTTKADRIALIHYANGVAQQDPGYWEFFRRTV